MAGQVDVYEEAARPDCLLPGLATRHLQPLLSNEEVLQIQAAQLGLSAGGRQTAGTVTAN